MLNPAARSQDSELAERYQREPYYMAADVYTNPSRYAQGGWSLYTGTAGWYYRVVMEELLGLRKVGSRLYLNPNLPPDWHEVRLELEMDNTALTVELRRAAEAAVYCDGNRCEAIKLDRKPHAIIVNIL
jgi:cyclic beta-1,2-glucan synthetase